MTCSLIIFLEDIPFQHIEIHCSSSLDLQPTLHDLPSAVRMSV